MMSDPARDQGIACEETFRDLVALRENVESDDLAILGAGNVNRVTGVAQESLDRRDVLRGIVGTRDSRDFGPVSFARALDHETSVATREEGFPDMILLEQEQRVRRVLPEVRSADRRQPASHVLPSGATQFAMPDRIERPELSFEGLTHAR